MATEVTLPQLGESVTEGTITAWLVEEGDHVDADQPLFELSSDKIDTEVPAPAAGVLQEIKVSVDETVDVGTVVAIIGDGDGEAEDSDAESSDADAEGADADADAEAEADTDADTDADADEQAEADTDEEAQEPAKTEDNGEGKLMSPIVRRLINEHGLDPAQISGSGKGGRITRDDVEAVIGDGETTEGEASKEKSREQKAATKPAAKRGGDESRRHSEDLSRIRQRIASRMMESMQSSAQLTTIQEADVSAIMALRGKHKDAFAEREGVSLSPFAFLARAAVLTLRRHPTVNAQADWEAGKVTYHDYVNLGIAVDTERGLLVPNVKNADDLTLAALARSIADVAGRARGEGGKLEMQDIEGGTFTVTNTGSRGVLLDTPILNYPEVAILATGAIQKRPVAVSDAAGNDSIGIRSMVYLCLTYDHQLLDGADAARFVSEVAETVETHDWASELGY